MKHKSKIALLPVKSRSKIVNENYPDGNPAARQATSPEEVNMSEEKTLQVLLAVDGSPHSAAAVAMMAGIEWPARTSVRVLAVVPERWLLTGLNPQAQQVVDDTLEKMRWVELAAAERLATQAAERLKEHGLAAKAEIYEGRPSEVILQRAALEGMSAELIVIGARGLSAPEEFQLGSTAYKVAQYAECSVLVIRPLEREQPLSVILATDGSPEAQRAAEFFCGFSLPQWAEITVVSVAESTSGLPVGEHESVVNPLTSPREAFSMPDVVRHALLDEAETRAAEAIKLLQDCGAQVQSTIRLGHPSGEILAIAREQDADLIAIGARGRTRAALFLLGGVAQKVVKYAPCSVLVVR